MNFSDPYGLKADCPLCIFSESGIRAAAYRAIDAFNEGAQKIGNAMLGIATAFMPGPEDVLVAGGLAARAGLSEAAGRIGRGHAFEKHVLDRGEFAGLGIRTTDQFSEFVGGIMTSASGADVRKLSNGRTAFWDGNSGTIVIHDPRHADLGTAFRPAGGRDYFDNIR